MHDYTSRHFVEGEWLYISNSDIERMRADAADAGAIDRVDVCDTALSDIIEELSREQYEARIQCARWAAER